MQLVLFEQFPQALERSRVASVTVVFSSWRFLTGWSFVF